MKEPTPSEISLPHNARCGERKSIRRCYPRALKIDGGMKRRVHHQARAWKRDKYNMKNEIKF
jgi:hypothetical protein